MKKTIQLVFVLMLVTVTKSAAQIFAEGKNLNQLDLEYIVVIVEQFPLKPTKYSIVDNQGRSNLTDSIGVNISFDKKNPDTIYNYFYKNGWELVSDNTNIVRIIFRRRKN